MSYQARFNFVGTPVIPKQKADTKRPFCKEMTKKDDKGKKREMLSMTFGVKESDSNMAFVEAFDSKQDVIKTMNTDNEKLDVNWDDRFDEDIVSQVASYRKYIVDLGEDHGGRQEFITVYDMIKTCRSIFPIMRGVWLLQASLPVIGMQRRRCISVSSVSRMSLLPRKSARVG